MANELNVSVVLSRAWSRHRTPLIVASALPIPMTFLACLSTDGPAVAGLVGLPFSALLFGLTLTAEADNAATPWFKFWLHHYLFGLFVSIVCALAVRLATEISSQDLLDHAVGEYAALVSLCYASGAYLKYCTHSPFSALALGAVNLIVFYATAALWNYGRWRWCPFGATPGQAACVCLFLSAASARAFLMNLRLGALPCRRWVPMVLMGICLATSAHGLVAMPDWHRLDPREIESFSFNTAPKGERALVTVHLLRDRFPIKTLGCPWLTTYVYDATTDTLTRTRGQIWDRDPEPWSPSGRRLLMWSRDGWCMAMWELDAKDVRLVRAIRDPIWHPQWLTDDCVISGEGGGKSQPSPDGRHRLLRTRLSRESLNDRLSLYHTATETVRTLRSVASPSADALSKWQRQSFSRDGRWLAVVWAASNGGQSRGSLEVIDLASYQPTVLGDSARYDDIRFSPDSQRMSAWHEANHQVEVFELASGAWTLRWIIPGPEGALQYSHGWVGSHNLILGVPHGGRASDACKAMATGSGTLWVASLGTGEVHMIWPKRWEHPTWRVMSEKGWKEKCK